MNDNFDLEPIKDEIAFFTEKTFQFSFVYVGALFATIAGTNLSFIEEIARQLNTLPTVITSMVVVWLNLIYLIVACSNGFAVLKRGYFIIVNHNDTIPNRSLVEWERFVRQKTASFGTIGWNVDNYYVIAIYTIAFILSVVFVVYGLINGNWLTRLLFVVATLAHVIPIWALVQLARLNQLCRESLTGSRIEDVQREQIKH